MTRCNQRGEGLTEGGEGIELCHASSIVPVWEVQDADGIEDLHMARMLVVVLQSYV